MLAGSGLCLVIGDKCMNVLNAQTGIGLVKTNGRASGSRRKVDELLQVFPAWRRRRALREFKQEVEDLTDIFREIRDVSIESAIIDGEEPNLVVFQFHELRKMRGSNFIEVLGRSPPTRSQKKLHFNIGQC